MGQAQGRPHAPSVASTSATTAATVIATPVTDEVVTVGMPVATPQASAQPSLSAMVEVFRQQLAAKGNTMPEVVANASRALGLDTEGLPLIEQANRAYEALGFHAGAV